MPAEPLQRWKLPSDHGCLAEHGAPLYLKLLLNKPFQDIDTTLQSPWISEDPWHQMQSYCLHLKICWCAACETCCSLSQQELP